MLMRSTASWVQDQFGVMHNGVDALPGALECFQHLSPPPPSPPPFFLSTRPRTPFAPLDSSLSVPRPGREWKADSDSVQHKPTIRRRYWQTPGYLA
eukprot:608783-Rhodomonas_salina.1